MKRSLKKERKSLRRRKHNGDKKWPRKSKISLSGGKSWKKRNVEKGIN